MIASEIAVKTTQLDTLTELNARDGLHPSDAGYRVWFDQLMAQADLAGPLAAAR